METHAATSMVLLSFDSPSPPPPPPLFGSATAPSPLEKASAVLLLLTSASPIAAFGWVLSSWLRG